MSDAPIEKSAETALKFTLFVTVDCLSVVLWGLWGVIIGTLLGLACIVIAATYAVLRHRDDRLNREANE